jgi:hypothetical protein
LSVAAAAQDRLTSLNCTAALELFATKQFLEESRFVSAIAAFLR